MSIETASSSSRCASLPMGAESACTIVIFGASGDLTARKLMPALYHLFLNNRLPDPVAIVGCARTPMDEARFRAGLKETCTRGNLSEDRRWDAFAARLSYQPVRYDDLDTFKALATRLRQVDQQANTLGNRIFYLAVPPHLYPDIADMLGRSGLAREGESGNGWSRIVVEKPFGHDLETALQLDHILHKSFQEQQIFRIDHYLAKETIQNLLMLRFANAIFEPLWNRNYIDFVGIIAAEELGVEQRAGYYEQAGVIRDMFQNHLLQLLALTAMEPPAAFEANRVQDEKIKVFRALKPLAATLREDDLILGQYGAGIVDGRQLAAYRNEPGVDRQSLCPTFAMMRLFVDNWRWRGVPFYLVSGKRLPRKTTAIEVRFKHVPHSMFQEVLGDHIAANRLTLGVYPEEDIRLTFQTKSPGGRACLRSVAMDFNYYQDYDGPVLDAYAKVLLDTIHGDHLLFWRQDGVEQAWSFLTPILTACESCRERPNQLQTYAAGSWGPEAARTWMEKVFGGIPRSQP